MKIKKTYLLILIFGALFLSACSGANRLDASSWPGITATEDVVYIAFGPHVYALDAVTGTQRWKYPAEADNRISYYSAPALGVDRDQLIIGGYDNILYSLNIENGLSEEWIFEGATNRYIGSTLATASGIYAPNTDGHLYALDYTGNPLWNNVYSTEDPIWSAPVTDGNAIYIAALDHQIHAIDINTGANIWTQDLETVSVSSPALHNGVLYASTFGNKVFAIDTANGNILWTFETEDWAWASPAATDTTVFFGDISGKFYGVDAATGVKVWDFSADGGIFGGALVAEDMVYFGTETGKVYALTVDGATEWFYSLTGKIYSTPVFNGEYLFIASIEGDVLVTALDLNGTARWPFIPEN